MSGNIYSIDINNDGTKTMVINGNAATNADYSITESDFQLSHSGRRSFLTTWIGIKLTVTRHGPYFGINYLDVKATVEPYWRHRVQGVCGTWNCDASDDFDCPSCQHENSLTRPDGSTCDSNTENTPILPGLAHT